MSGVGSTNAMKKGSANNPFLAFSEADMKGYLNSAYTGCIVKYTGDPIARNLSDINKTVPERAQSLVFNKSVPKANWGCLKITTKSGDTETVQYLRTLFYNYQTKEISWYNSSWIPFLAICNTQHPTNASDLTGLKILWVPTSYETNSDDYPEYWPVTLGWQGENVDADGKVTLWGYSEDVSFVYLEDGKDSYIIYNDMPCVITPYEVDKLYKVVYRNNEYYYEEFYYISEDKTTAGVEDVAPGKTFYDFAGTKQIGTGTRANPFLARSDSDMNAFNNATYLGKFVKYIGKTNDTYIKDAIYQVTNDATEYDRYMLLPTLENEGKASDLAQGKQLINSQGEVVEGTAESAEGKLAMNLFAKTITDINDLQGSIKSWPAVYYSVNNYYRAAFCTSCKQLSRVILPSISSLGSSIIPSSAFYGCTNLKYIDVGYFTQILSNAFTNCTNLREIKGTENVSYIASSAFVNAKFVQDDEFVLPKFSNVTQCMADYAFLRAELFDITDEVFPSLTYISGYSAFYGTKNITKISLTNLQTISGYYVFQYCQDLQEINCPNLLRIYGQDCFGTCSKLSSINMPSVSIIGSYAFRYCRELKYISLPAVTTIYSGAFVNCTFSKIILPSLSKMTGDPFYSCKYLTSVYLTNSVVCSVSSNVFRNTPMMSLYSEAGYNYGSIYVPMSLLSEYKTTTYWSNLSDRFVGLTDEEIALLE